MRQGEQDWGRDGKMSGDDGDEWREGEVDSDIGGCWLSDVLGLVV